VCQVLHGLGYVLLSLVQVLARGPPLAVGHTDRQKGLGFRCCSDGSCASDDICRFFEPGSPENLKTAVGRPLQATAAGFGAFEDLFSTSQVAWGLGHEP
jgi:hypothetical protein